MRVRETPLPGVLAIEPDVYRDERGAFLETYRQASYAEHIPAGFVQDNLVHSVDGVLRGLHLQHPHGQAKLVTAVSGEVWDVCVDVRIGSPTFGKWHAETLTGENALQIFIPTGFAHGYCVLSERAGFAYKVSDVYHGETELTIRWDDPELGIPWPVSSPKLSAKDAAGFLLTELRSRLPRYEGP